MIKVGLTGSIAVGKSLVCSFLKKGGCYVLDADVLAREVVEKGTPGLRRIIEEFGSGVLDAEGNLDRKVLGSIVFSDSVKRAKLNSIVHPLVIERQNQWFDEISKKDPAAIAVVEAALMIESGGWRRFDKLVVVWCKDEIQIERLMKRDKISRQQAQLKINSQLSQTEKRKFADYEIDTSDGIESVERQCNKLLKELKNSVSHQSG
jgi:dephospho-CoA kinase